MATSARRGTMPHHHVPEPKETSPLVDRLRLELNRTVRRTVTEAVDKVWVAFEDDLTQLTTFPPVNDYELFYNCCKRLTMFIDNNMDTTPGFLEQMDRLILACHNGATESTACSMMTKDLRIRRGKKQKNDKKYVKVKTDTTPMNDNESPVISPPNGTIEREESSEEELKITATVGTESRQWTTRKRLSTTSSRQLRPKRLKRSVTSRDTDERDENETKRVENEIKEKTQSSTAKQVAVKRTSRRSRCVRRLEKQFGDDHGNNEEMEISRDSHSAERRADPRRNLRCNFKSLSADSRQTNATGKSYQTRLKSKKGEQTRSNTSDTIKLTEDTAVIGDNGFDPQIGEGCQTRLKSKKGGQTQSKTSDTSKLTEDTDVIEENGLDPQLGEGCQTRSKSKQDEQTQSKTSDTTKLKGDTDVIEDNGLDRETLERDLSEREVADVGKQEDATASHAQLFQEAEPPCDVEIVTKENESAGVDEGVQSKTHTCNIADLEHNIEVMGKNKNVSREGEDQEKNRSASADDPGQQQQTDVDQAGDDLTNVAAVENNGGHIVNAETIQSIAKLFDEQVVRDEDARCNSQGVSDILQEFLADQENLQHPVAADTIVYGATNVENAMLSQEVETVAESVQEEDNSSESDAVPGLCDAGMRTPQQVSHFKACLRKSIQCVDAFQCNPPSGKKCVRNCKKIRSRKCSEGMPCRDQLCRNWHNAEAHTERCKNPLCEFTNRIILRETMHQVAKQDVKIHSLQLKWEEKVMERAVAETNSTNERYTPERLLQLDEHIGLLGRIIADAQEEADSLRDAKRVRLANLSAIGIKPQDDVADGFPNFETHYE